MTSTAGALAKARFNWIRFEYAPVTTPPTPPTIFTQWLFNPPPRDWSFSLTRDLSINPPPRNLSINPSRVRFIGTPCIPPDGGPGCFLCWQGGYVGFRWQCATWGIWAGWATSPSDSLGIPKDWRAYGFGPVLMILRF